MIGAEGVLVLLKLHGLSLLAPLAVLEGPIVTVIAAYLASLAFFDVWLVYVVVVVADLVGDSIFYALGRRGPGLLSPRWRNRFGVTDARLGALKGHFHNQGGRTLVVGKLTHSAGMVVLLAAGAARMPFWRFLGFNLIATLPKSLVFVIIGYTLGRAYTAIDGWIFRASFALLVLSLVAIAAWYLYRRGVRG
ncbi:DedA family protein [Phaeovulum sp.]|uniref:DedA family protein n=1 Tax=Phaeovulum sp. TaxID=2934796 RepID=UPI0035624C68